MFDKCLFFNLNALTREVNKRWEDEFAQLGLSASHGYTLRLALEHPGATQKELAEYLSLAPSTVTRFIDALEKKGYLKRVMCADDARACRVQPTKKAEALQKGIDEAIVRLTGFLQERLGTRAVSEFVGSVRDCQTRLLDGATKDD